MLDQAEMVEVLDSASSKLKAEAASSAGTPVSASVKSESGNSDSGGDEKVEAQTETTTSKDEMN